MSYERDKQIVAVLNAIELHHCNNTQDVSDVTGLPVPVCSNYISELIKDGVLARTGRTIKNNNARAYGPTFKCFELVTRTESADVLR